MLALLWTLALVIQEPRSVDALRQALGDADLQTRRDAAYELSQLGEKAAPATAELIQALDDQDRQVWLFSVQALGRIWSAGQGRGGPFAKGSHRP